MKLLYKEILWTFEMVDRGSRKRSGGGFSLGD
jgi:hypothetical protein